MEQKKLTAKEAVDRIKAICQSLDSSVVWSCTDTAFTIRQPDEHGNQVEQPCDGQFTLTIEYRPKPQPGDPTEAR
ncbi:MAG: hypothetical protein ACM359_14335 [Bacillota bacterium]